MTQVKRRKQRKVYSAETAQAFANAVNASARPVYPATKSVRSNKASS